MKTSSLDTRHAPPKVRQTRLLIDGSFRDSVDGKTFPTINPATEEKIADVAEGGPLDVDLAVKAARRAFADGSPWRRLDARERGRLLYAWADRIDQNLDELAA